MWKLHENVPKKIDSALPPKKSSKISFESTPKSTIQLKSTISWEGFVLNVFLCVILNEYAIQIAI